MNRIVLPVVAALAVTGASIVALATPAAPDKPDAPDKIDRLFGLARVWAEAKFFHPAMFERAIDLDGALIKAIPEVEAATDAKTYRVAIEHLLAAIGDPRTTASLATKRSAPAGDWKSWAAKDVLVFDAVPTDPFEYMATRRRARDLLPDLTAAKVVVVDLRRLADGEDEIFDSIVDNLPSTQTWPTIKAIRHDGYRSQGESNRDTYPTSWVITSSGAPTKGAPPGPSHVVFVVDPQQALPLIAVALWASDHATLVSTRAFDDSAVALTKSIDLPYGVVAHIRTADVILPGGRALVADLVVGRGDDVRARAIAVASAIATGGVPPRGPERRATISYDLRVVDDDDSPQTGLPSRERRLLAGMRVWAVIEYFHGVRRLNHDWDKQFRNAVPRLDAATDVETYRDVLEEMLAALNDGHTGVYALAERGMRGGTALYWRRIEGKIVAGGFRDEAQAKTAGIALGDELVSVNGVPVEDAVARKRRTIGSGTDEARRQWAVAIVDRGPRGTTVDDEVRGADGKVRRVTLKREFGYEQNYWARSGPHFRVLTGDIGYADLARLTSDEVDAMFDALAKTRAIVFDMRGYPNGTGWLIAERINTRNTKALAEFRTPIVTASSHDYDATTRFVQRGRTTTKPLYRGKIVVLIDDRAISAAEHACLALEAAGGAKFVGSPTTGTNGEETYERLPGGVEMRFTGQEVLHADGRQLQQVGIQPDITVRPTLRGLRAGKDEVLDRALRYLQTGK